MRTSQLRSRAVLRFPLSVTVTTTWFPSAEKQYLREQGDHLNLPARSKGSRSSLRSLRKFYVNVRACRSYMQWLITQRYFSFVNVSRAQQDERSIVRYGSKQAGGQLNPAVEAYAFELIIVYVERIVWNESGV